MTRTAGYKEILMLKSPDCPLFYPQEPPCFPTVLPTVGCMGDCPHPVGPVQHRGRVGRDAVPREAPTRAQKISNHVVEPTFNSVSQIRLQISVLRIRLSYSPLKNVFNREILVFG